MNHKQAYRVQRIIVIVALLLILFGDTNMNGVFSFSHQPQQIWFYPQLVVALMTAAGPNLLLMALGAAQLRRPALAISQLIRQILWLIGGIALFSLFFYLEDLLGQSQGLANFNLAGFFTALAQAPVGFYDILYELLGFFVTLPLLRVIAHHASITIQRYLFWAELVFIGMVPIVVFFTGLTTINIDPPLAITAGCFFALMGYWLSQADLLTRITREQLLVAWLLTVACYAVMVSVTMYQVNLEHNFDLISSQPFAQTFQAIPCLTLWVTVATWVMNRTTLKQPRRHNFVQTTYGTLLVAGLLIEPFTGINRVLTPIIGAWWAAWLWTLAVGLVSVEVVWLLRHWRFARQLLPDLFGGAELSGGLADG